MDELEELFVNYPSVADALRQGLIKSAEGTRALGRKADIEYGGLVGANPDGTFYLLENAPARGERDKMHIRQRLRRKGDKVAGIYHSHPGEDQLAERFSETDITTAGALGVPSAIVEAQRPGLEGHEFISGRHKVRRGGGVQGAWSEGAAFMGGRPMQREYLTPREKTASLEELMQDALVAQLRNPVARRN